MRSMLMTLVISIDAAGAVEAAELLGILLVLAFAGWFFARNQKK